MAAFSRKSFAKRRITEGHDDNTEDHADQGNQHGVGEIEFTGCRQHKDGDGQQSKQAEHGQVHVPHDAVLTNRDTGLGVPFFGFSLHDLCQRMESWSGVYRGRTCSNLPSGLSVKR